MPPARPTLDLTLPSDVGVLVIRLLSDADGNDLQRLCERCHDYFELVTGLPVGGAEAQSLFSGLPPGKMYNDKFLFGVFRSSALVGVIDLIRDWRSERSWTLGLLLLDQAIRGHGVGRALVGLLDAVWFQRAVPWSASGHGRIRCVQSLRMARPLTTHV